VAVSGKLPLLAGIGDRQHGPIGQRKRNVRARQHGEDGGCQELSRLYFRQLVGQFGRRMTRRFLWIFMMALAGLPAAQISSRADTTAAALAKAAVLENDILYLRASHVGKNMAEEIQFAATTNKIIGTVLDLRFADGDDPGAVKAVANLFAAKKLPLTILVNGETRGEAVALAAILHEAHEGLIFGSTTRETKSRGPIQPDVAVKASPDDERALMEDPYAAQAPNETNSPAATNNLLPFVDHTSEADLVRAKIKDGDEDENLPMERITEPQKPFIRDPVLARAVDLIKGLAIVRASHS
jgi:hypothetical protein